MSWTFIRDTKVYECSVSKMTLIQSEKFRTCQTGHFKMPHYKTCCFQKGVFEMGLQLPLGIVKSEQSKK